MSENQRLMMVDSHISFMPNLSLSASKHRGLEQIQLLCLAVCITDPVLTKRILLGGSGKYMFPLIERNRCGWHVVLSALSSVLM